MSSLYFCRASGKESFQKCIDRTGSSDVPAGAEHNFSGVFDQTSVLEQHHGDDVPIRHSENNSEDLPQYHDCLTSTVVALLAPYIYELA
jgi:hypothetical protein